MCKKLLLVDLYTGKHLEIYEPYEQLNFVRNPDGMFYGNVPPDDIVDIRRLDKKAITYVKDVLVVYVRVVNKNRDKSRKIIAYCKNATVFRKPQTDKNESREFKDTDGVLKYATYSIKSDNLTIIDDSTCEFIIDRRKYDMRMFRKQRSYLENKPELKEKIIAFICGLEHANYQRQLQNAKPASEDASKRHSQRPDQIASSNGIQYVVRNQSIAKKILDNNNYRCAIDSNHSTFQTRLGVAYMEAHHLIPCTVSNSQRFQKKSKLDREENIVCLCPTCHRAVHYGEINEKRKKLKILFEKQKDKLESVGLNLSFDELMELYGEKNHADF